MSSLRFLGAHPALCPLFRPSPRNARRNHAPPVPVTILSKAVTANVASTDESLLNAAGNQDDWLLYGRTYDNQRFSPLTQIDRSNVKRLAVKAIIHTGFFNSMEATPIVVDGTMYVSTPSDHVQAYDAATGELKWSYNPVLGYTDNCCGPQSRGVAVAYGKVFIAQLDGHVVALDARTGAVVWKSVIADTVPEPTHYYAFTMAPQVFNGMVLVGNSGAEYPTRGFVEALDANDRQADLAISTPPRRRTSPAARPGTATAGNMAAARCGTRRRSIPKNNLVLFATGNPNPDYWGENRKGDNAYTDSIVAIDSRTGRLRWWYQQVPHDVWDYDCPSPVILFDAKDENGKTVPAAAEAGKIGNVFIVNRLTGKLLHKSDAFVKQADNMFIIPSDKPFSRYPGISGGNLWSPAAYSPLTQNFYVMGINQAFTVTAFPFPKYVPGTPTVGQQVGGTQKTFANRPVSGGRDADRHQRQHRQDRLAGQDRAAHVWRHPGHRQQPDLHRRDERLVRRLRRGHWRKIVVAESGYRSLHAADHLSRQGHAICGGGCRGLQPFHWLVEGPKQIALQRYDRVFTHYAGLTSGMARPRLFCGLVRHPVCRNSGQSTNRRGS